MLLSEPMQTKYIPKRGMFLGPECQICTQPPPYSGSLWLLRMGDLGEELLVERKIYKCVESVRVWVLWGRDEESGDATRGEWRSRDAEDVRATFLVLIFVLGGGTLVRSQFDVVSQNFPDVMCGSTFFPLTIECVGSLGVFNAVTHEGITNWKKGPPSHSE